MKRRELAIFNVSFLDLLSGALAAVIILFVIVPKLDSKSKEAREALDKLDLRAGELRDRIEELEARIEPKLYNEVMRQLEELNEAVENVQERVEKLEQEKKSIEQERNQLREENVEQRAQITRLQSDNKEVADELAKSKLFGIDCEVAIVFSWQEQADVDLFMRKSGYNDWCYYGNSNTSFATLLKDITSSTGNGYEMIYQETVVSGTYDLFLNLFDLPEDETTVEASGYIELYPFSERQQRIELGTIHFTRADENTTGRESGKFVRTITITENAIR